MTQHPILKDRSWLRELIAPVALAMLAEIAASSARRVGRERNDAVRMARRAELQRAVAEAERATTLRRLAAGSTLLVFGVGMFTYGAAPNLARSVDSVRSSIMPRAPETEPARVQHNPHLVLIFSGSYWQRNPTGIKQAADLTNFMRSLSGSRYLQVMKGYRDRRGVVGDQISVSAIFDPNDPQPIESYDGVAKEIGHLKSQGLIENSSLHGPDIQYAVVLPPETSLDGVCGWHGAFDVGGSKVVITASSWLCPGGFQGLVDTETHEAFEAAVNPDGGNPEIADQCDDGRGLSVQSHLVAALWDPRTGRCQSELDVYAPW